MLDSDTWNHSTVCKRVSSGSLKNVTYCGVRQRSGQAVLPFFFLSDSILRLFYFYPTLPCWSNFLNKKAQKELYERRQQQIGNEDVFFKFFPLFPGFNNHSMGEGIFPEYNRNSWIEVFKNTLIVSWYICVLVVEGNFVFWFGAQFNSTHNFTQSGWHILLLPYFFSGQQKLGKLPNTLSLTEQCCPVRKSYWPFFNSSSSMDTGGNLSNLWIPCVYHLDQGIPVEYELDTFNSPPQEQLYVTPKIGYVDAMPNPALDT